MKKHMRYLISALMMLTLFTTAKAQQTGDTVIYNFSGVFMMSTSCTIDNDQVMNISFGNVGIKKVDGVTYKQPIPYIVDCHGAPDDSPLNLTVSGNAVSFDQAAVVTSADGLGIQIQANGAPMQLNKSITTTLGGLSSMELTAVPVKDPGKALTGQAFSATATLTADYQ
ncbi:fimbrial protein [Citrobacter sp. NCU1]|uniref:fimbrial protein n=1 Tax=Citrobacter sp. NCU1 TaxID=2026683 RepID=UPI00139165FE|nr:fimbrial protein [Citrobacter sp. NCU1]NDO83183.1 fimbrial protein [Citrobacter sp. NCU1]